MMPPSRITLLIHDLPTSHEPELDREVLAALLRSPPRRSVETHGTEQTLVYELSGEELVALINQARSSRQGTPGNSD